jgi:hypothetical protein
MQTSFAELTASVVELHRKSSVPASLSQRVSGLASERFGCSLRHSVRTDGQSKELVPERGRMRFAVQRLRNVQQRSISFRVDRRHFDSVRLQHNRLGRTRNRMAKSLSSVTLLGSHQRLSRASFARLDCSADSRSLSPGMSSRSNRSIRRAGFRSGLCAHLHTVVLLFGRHCFLVHCVGVRLGHCVRSSSRCTSLPSSAHETLASGHLRRGFRADRRSFSFRSCRRKLELGSLLPQHSVRFSSNLSFGRSAVTFAVGRPHTDVSQHALAVHCSASRTSTGKGSSCRSNDSSNRYVMRSDAHTETC